MNFACGPRNIQLMENLDGFIDQGVFYHVTPRVHVCVDIPMIFISKWEMKGADFSNDNKCSNISCHILAV